MCYDTNGVEVVAMILPSLSFVSVVVVVLVVICVVT